MSDASASAACGDEANERGAWWTFLPRLTSGNVLLLGGGLVLPNLLSFATLVSLIDIGLPPRTTAIMLYASLSILARHIPFALTAALFLCVLAFDMVSTLSLMFGMAPTEMMAAFDLARRLHFFASPLYLSLIVLMLTTTLAALACLSQRGALVRGRTSLLFVLALTFGALDYASNVSPHYHFGSTFGHDKPVQSAAEVSGFNLAAGAHGNNVVVVIVESLGYLLDQTARERIAAPLYDPAVTRDYLVTSGHTVYYGSTTSGEMRELCNTRTFYVDYVPKNGSSCLPNLLKSRGYASIALHAYSGGMFEREQWYPEVGFDKELFGDELVKTTHRSCGAVFRGACDADLAPVIVDASLQAAHTGKPRFIYWLTLNTHIPVAPDEALSNFQCALPNNGFALPRICRMAELWHDVFAVVAKIARDPAVGPADILVVGDHAPPLWSKRGRAEFAPGQVAWYRLQPRTDATGGQRLETLSQSN
jgi:Sulfatase